MRTRTLVIRLTYPIGLSQSWKRSIRHLNGLYQKEDHQTKARSLTQYREREIATKRLVSDSIVHSHQQASLWRKLS